MNALVNQKFGPVSSVFAGQQAVDDLSAGVQASYGLIGYKGKVWSIKFRGDERPIMRPDGDGPMNSIEIVILKASTVVAKIWYEAGYTEGSTAAPDCFSNNGVAPEPTSRKLQSPACATCPRNAWGSRITPAGKQGKECSDNKRLAIVPLADIRNEALGGPMLLRVPAASLQDLASFGTQMQALGYPYYSIGIRVSFDPNEAYPKFQFKAIRGLTDDEAHLVVAMQQSPLVHRILSETPPDYREAQQEVQRQTQLAQAFEQPPQAAAAHGTGVASTQPAPSATSTGPATPTPATPPATPAQATPSAQEVGTAPPAGGAQTVGGGQTTETTSLAQTTGFGPLGGNPTPTAGKSQPSAPQATSQPSTGIPASTGFGGPASPQGTAQPAASPPIQTVPASETASPSVQTASPSNGAAVPPGEWEDELDKKLAALLPT